MLELSGRASLKPSWATRRCSAGRCFWWFTWQISIGIFQIDFVKKNTSKLNLSRRGIQCYPLVHLSLSIAFDCWPWSHAFAIRRMFETARFWHPAEVGGLAHADLPLRMTVLNVWESGLWASKHSRSLMEARPIPWFVILTSSTNRICNMWHHFCTSTLRRDRHM